MEFKKVWMSPETGKRSQYGYRTVGGILGIVLLMTLLLFGGTFLSLSMGIEQKEFSLLLLLAVSGLGIGLAILMSRRSIQDATIFFLTEDDRLWVMDARGLSNHGAVSYTHLDVYKRQILFLKSRMQMVRDAAGEQSRRDRAARQALKKTLSGLPAFFCSLAAVLGFLASIVMAEHFREKACLLYTSRCV